MRLFHELVAEDFVPDTNNHFTKRIWDPVMGNVDVLRIMVVADSVSGGAPTFTLNIYDNADLTDATLNIISQPLANAPLVAGTSNILTVSVAPSAAPVSYAYSFLYVLGGASPKAHIRIWVTGRGRV